jgi:hypothetical protein
MPHIQKLGGIAAFVNIVVAVATLVVAIALIGPSALADPSKLVDLAIHNPAPLIIQDGLKFVSAAIASVLILALASRLRRDNSTLLSIATGFGLLSVLCLVVNATLSLYATFQAATYAREASAIGIPLNGIIGLLAMAVLILNGMWYLLVSWIALKSQRLPKALSYLGLGMGVISLVPPLGIIVLLLSMVWSAGVGRVLLQEGQAC